VRAQLHVTHLDKTIDRLHGRIDYRPDGAGPPTAIYTDRTDYQPDRDGGVGRRQYRVAGHNAHPQTFPTDTWNSLTDNAISAPSLSTFRHRLETFPFQASFPDIITDPR